MCDATEGCANEEPASPAPKSGLVVLVLGRVACRGDHDRRQGLQNLDLDKMASNYPCDPLLDPIERFWFRWLHANINLSGDCFSDITHTPTPKSYATSGL